jgi:hypothetical protein
MIPVKGLQNTRPLDSKPIRILAKLLPFMFRRCRFGRHHWRWERLCYDGRGFFRDAAGKPWEGGILDLRSGAQFHPGNEVEVLKAAKQYMLTGSPMGVKLPRRIRRQLWRRSWDAVKGR